MIIIDELDKWLKGYINGAIDKKREDASKIQTQQFGNQTNQTTQTQILKPTEEEEKDKRIQLKETFLDQLYTLSEGNMFSSVDSQFVFIFNTNEFYSIFEGMKDIEKFDAYKKRFDLYEFNYMNKQELIVYLNKYIQSFTDNYNAIVNPKDYLIEANRIFRSHIPDEKEFEGIKDSIKISIRDLYKILRRYCYNMQEVVKYLSSDNDDVKVNT